MPITCPPWGPIFPCVESGMLAQISGSPPWWHIRSPGQIFLNADAYTRHGPIQSKFLSVEPGT